jgi:hypothetical protein
VTQRDQNLVGPAYLSDYPADEFPDAGQIAEIYLLNLSCLNTIFLLLIERKQKEPWTENTASVHFSNCVKSKSKRQITISRTLN